MVRAVINEGLQRYKASNLVANNIAVVIAFLKSCEALVSNCVGPINSNVTMTYKDASSSTPSPMAKTGVTSKPIEREPLILCDPTLYCEACVPDQDRQYCLYYKESLANGVTVEYHHTIKLRHCRKEKHRARDNSKSKKSGHELPRKIENKKAIALESSSNSVS